MQLRYSTKRIDQIYRRGYGWQAIAPIRLRDLYNPIRSDIAKTVLRVRIVGMGDYTIDELTRATRGQRCTTASTPS